MLINRNDTGLRACQIVVALLWIPLKCFSAARIIQATKEQRIYSNARLDKVIEMLGCIKLAKLTTLDAAMASEISKLRAEEMGKLANRYVALAVDQVGIPYSECTNQLERTPIWAPSERSIQSPASHGWHDVHCVHTV